MKELIIDGDSAPVVRDLTPEEIAAFPQASRRALPKSTVMARLIDAGKASEAKTMLDADPVAFFRWHAPDWPNVYADDEGLLTFLTGLGLTEEQIAAVTA